MKCEVRSVKSSVRCRTGLVQWGGSTQRVSGVFDCSCWLFAVAAAAAAALVVVVVVVVVVAVVVVAAVVAAYRDAHSFCGFVHAIRNEHDSMLYEISGVSPCKCIP